MGKQLSKPRCPRVIGYGQVIESNNPLRVLCIDTHDNCNLDTDDNSRSSMYYLIAMWLLPEDWVYGGWPMSGEIDIVEIIGRKTLCNIYTSDQNTIICTIQPRIT